jgi:small subunit ribosomal protein S2
MMARQRDKLSKNLSGIKNLTRLPGLMFVVDSKKERIAGQRRATSSAFRSSLLSTRTPIPISSLFRSPATTTRSSRLSSVTHAISDAIVEARREAPIREETEEDGVVHVQLRPRRRAGRRRRSQEEAAAPSPSGKAGKQLLPGSRRAEKPRLVNQTLETPQQRLAEQAMRWLTRSL